MAFLKTFSRLLPLVLIIALIAAPVRAQAQHASDTLSFRKIMRETIPKCLPSQTLTHIGVEYKCVDNSPNVKCPDGATKELASDGVTVVCSTDDIATGCDPGMVISDPVPGPPIIDGTPPVVGSSVCIPASAQPIECDPDQVLTTILDASGNVAYACLPMTGSFVVPADSMGPYHGWCNSDTVIAHVHDTSGNPIDGFSAWCMTACKRFCDSRYFAGVKLFGSGYLTDFDGTNVNCACVR
jgi:hypothetical protein